MPRGATSRTRRNSAGVRNRCSRFTRRQVGAAHAPSLHDGQALASAQTTPLEHGTASGGQHALQKAVLAFTGDPFRLVSTLGHRALFLESGASGSGVGVCLPNWRSQLPHVGEAQRVNWPPV